MNRAAFPTLRRDASQPPWPPVPLPPSLGSCSRGRSGPGPTRSRAGAKHTRALELALTLGKTPRKLHPKIARTQSTFCAIINFSALEILNNAKEVSPSRAPATANPFDSRVAPQGRRVCV